MNDQAGKPGQLWLIRTLIDRVDAGILMLAATRRRLVRLAAASKATNAGRDPQRETVVYAHARRVGDDLGLPADTSQRLLSVLVRDACEQQGLPPDPDQGGDRAQASMIAAMPMDPIVRLAAFLPPPRVLSPWLRQLPRAWHARWFERAMRHALSDALGDGSLAFLEQRTLAIEVEDLGLAWSVGMRDGQLCVLDTPAEAAVRGTVTNLMLLASRVEDADTLFFQRRLVLTGDTELGLLARNTLDRLDWERVPLSLRILLHRAARFAAAAREAHHQARDRLSQPASPSQ